MSAISIATTRRETNGFGFQRLPIWYDRIVVLLKLCICQIIAAIVYYIAVIIATDLFGTNLRCVAINLVYLEIFELCYLLIWSIVQEFPI